MNLRNLTYLARIAEQNALVAAMQADNAIWTAQGQSPLYGHAHFLECAQELEAIANEMRRDQKMGMQ